MTEWLAPRAGDSVSSEESVDLLLAAQRARAERRLNVLRAVVLLLLAAAAVAYAPALTEPLNRVNVVVLAPTLGWTLAQWLLYYRRGLHPAWLATVNPLVDITAVTVIIGGYGIAQSPVLALKTPIFLAYFVILAARPVTSSARKAAAAAILALSQYLALVMFFALSSRLTIVASPLTASSGAGVSPLDEGAKLMLLGLAGAVATYATYWHEALVRTHHSELRNRQELEVRLTRAQLQSLKLQLHPHFLFNALNTITALIRRDPDAAERTVSGLSETLRLSLRNAGEQEVSLSRELEILQHYIDIQQIRFQNRLTVTMSIDPEVRQAMVPNLLLQPLVENAIRHGIEPRACGGHVSLQASRAGGRLNISIIDDGVGLRESRSPKGHGIGVANTRERLSRMYGGQHSFVIRNAESGGVAVEIEIPFRRAGEEAQK